MFHISKAMPQALKAIGLLSPHVQAVDLAGSLRRCKQEVKDIELVLIPKRETIGSVDLFGAGVVSERVVPGFVRVIEGLGSVVKGRPDGKMMQIDMPLGSKEHISLDLFMPQWYDYYRIFAIRTGSAQYSHSVIANGWLRKGWCGSDVGLRLQKDCTSSVGADGKTKWKCINPSAETPPIWESEKAFFDWLGIQWISPKFRNF